MRSQGMSLARESKDDCPVCGARIRLAEVEPHPIRAGLAILGFHCETCGPVKSLVVVSQMKNQRRLC